jgi:hypothetical protein
MKDFKIYFYSFLFLLTAVIALIVVVYFQKQKINTLQNQIKNMQEQGALPIPPWIPPWDNFTPTSPEQTPSELNYDKKINEFKKELEGLEDEKILSYYGNDAVIHRDNIVHGYTEEFRRIIKNKTRK